jgi:cytidylate kinase
MVTVSRQLGSGGEAVAQAAAARLGFRYFDSEVITRAATEAEVSEDLVSQAEQIPSLRQRMLQALAANPGLSAAGWFQPAEAAPGLFMTSADYRRFIEDVVREIATEGEAVVLGHAGQVLLHDRWDTLKVLVTGSPEQRAQRVQGMLETHDHALAEKTLTDWDAGRRAFYDRCYHIDWLSPVN